MGTAAAGADNNGTAKKCVTHRWRCKKTPTAPLRRQANRVLQQPISDKRNRQSRIYFLGSRTANTRDDPCRQHPATCVLCTRLLNQLHIVQPALKGGGQGVAIEWLAEEVVHAGRTTGILI